MIELNFETIKDFYDKGLWTAKMVSNAVAKGKITAEEYQIITGLAYSE